MTDHSTGTPVSVPARRLVAAGFIRRSPGRTMTVCATQAGVTGTIRKAVRVAELHQLAAADYASNTDRRVQDRRDDTHLLAAASEASAGVIAKQVTR
ncbi:hypothetical protein [Streptomyces phaeochromogenes]|uniref:hypothetical protein n=1 Tax=Streptomyces phaeochromogenes TaxID=1923 RepID=UPI002DD9C57E|nr:hypothetical protein [Streptomyces phaeochromogenes]WRZ31357.1 hypothetical protein OG931_28235 [Streptomyces phaeochromogenes]